MMPLTAIILIKARLLERLLAIIGSLKILTIKFLPKMVKTLLREDQHRIIILALIFVITAPSHSCISRLLVSSCLFY